MTATSTNRTNAIDKINAYRDYAKHHNCYVTPKKGTNSGSDGRMNELAVKMCLNNYRFNGIVASAKSIDTTKKINGKMVKFEIKTGCGTLAVIDRNGDIVTSPTLKSDYIIYTPEYLNSQPVCKQAFVFPVQVFLMVLNDCGLLRYKYSGQQYEINKNGEKVRKADAYHDKLTIQTYLNSKKKTALFYSKIAEYGIRLDEFCTINNIKFNAEV